MLTKQNKKKSCILREKHSGKNKVAGSSQSFSFTMLSILEFLELETAFLVKSNGFKTNDFLSHGWKSFHPMLENILSYG